MRIVEFQAKQAREIQNRVNVVLNRKLITAIADRVPLDDIERALVDTKLDFHSPVQTLSGQKHYTPLFAAIYFHNYDVVQLLVESKRVDINKIDERNWHCAVTFAASLCTSNTGDAVRVFKYLYEKNAPHVDRAFGRSGQTAAMELARDETLELLEYVKERGADLNIVDANGDNILTYAFYRRDAKLVPDAATDANYLLPPSKNTIGKLVELGVDVNHANDDGDMLVDLATKLDQQWAVEQLQDCGGLSIDEYTEDDDDDE